MRLFIAIRFDNKILDALTRYREELKKLGVTGRFTPRENLHLTLAFIGEYLETGMPLVEKCITLDGSAVKEPKNVIAPIGTAIKDVIESAGGLKSEAAKILYGGPMMGIAVPSADEPILKNTNAIIDSVHFGDKVPLLLIPDIFVSTVITHLCGGSAGRGDLAAETVEKAHGFVPPFSV